MILGASALIPAAGRNPDIGNVDTGLLGTYERIQKRFGRDLPINSGYRSPQRNFAAGGAKRSQHMEGNALDIDVRDLSKQDRLRLIQIASEEGITGVGVYDNALHFDTGPRRAWGPSYKRESIPEWAKPTVGQHLYGRFKAPQTQMAGGGGATTMTGGEVNDTPKGGYFTQWYNETRAPTAEGNATAPAQGGYFSQWYQENRAKEPKVNTTAPTAPAGMDAPVQPGFFRRTADAAIGAVAGNAEYDVPEIESQMPAMRAASKGDPGALSRALFAADGEAAMADIIQKFSPETPIEADANGNLYAIVNGERYALDKSGLSGRDATELVKGLVTGLVTLAGARAGGFLFGGIGRGAGAGVGAGAEQAGEQALSQYMGSEQPFDMGRVLLGSVFGVGGEALAGIVNAVGPRVVEAIGQAKLAGPSVREFEASLRAQGFDPQEVIDALNSGLRRSGQAELGPEALARIADAKMMDVPLDLTAGQATRSPGLWRQEHSAYTFGDEAGRAAEAVRQEQQAILAQNVEAISGGFRGAATNVAGRGERVQQALVQRRMEAWQGVNAAYDRARAAPNQPVVDPGIMGAFIEGTRDYLKGKYVPAPDTSTSRVLDDFENIIQEGGTPFLELEKWRSRAVAERSSAKGSDLAALNELIRVYDRASEGVLMKNATGDKNAVGLWRRAVKARSEFGKKYENDSIVDRLSRKNKDRPGELDIDAEDVMGELLGKSGFGNKKGVAREARRLRDFLGPDSPEWANIQAEAFNRLLGFEPSNFAGGNISTKIVGNLRKALDEHPDLFNAIFTENQQRQIRRFARTVQNTSIRPMDAGTPNPSGSGLMMIEDAGRRYELIQKAAIALGKAFGPSGDIIARYVVRATTEATSAANAQAMQRSLQGLPPVASPRAALPGGAGGLIGGNIGEERARYKGTQGQQRTGR